VGFVASDTARVSGALNVFFPYVFREKGAVDRNRVLFPPMEGDFRKPWRSWFSEMDSPKMCRGFPEGQENRKNYATRTEEFPAGLSKAEVGWEDDLGKTHVFVLAAGAVGYATEGSRVMPALSFAVLRREGEAV